MEKQAVYQAFRETILQRLNLIRSNLDDLKETGKNETKSTAGDKHETALAMIQLEQEKMRSQLREVQQQMVDLEKIDPAKTAAVIARGSIVTTDRGIFWISLALGKISIAGEMVLALSPQAPLGAGLIGCKAGDTITVNNTVYTIISVA
jgi:hypothetical protein